MTIQLASLDASEAATKLNFPDFMALNLADGDVVFFFKAFEPPPPSLLQQWSELYDNEITFGTAGGVLPLNNPVRASICRTVLTTENI
jgi:hypothetical protein